MTTLRLTAAFLAMLASMSVSFAGGTLNLLPPVSPQYSPTMIVQAAQIQHSKSKAVGDRTIGVCYLVENRGSGLDPVRGLENYFRFVEHKDINAVGIPNIQIAQKPAHGQITYYKSGYTYEPSNGYEGRDRVTFVIEANGHKFTLVYFIHVVHFVENSRSLCPKFSWRMALNQDAAEFNDVDLASPAIPWSRYDFSNAKVHLNIKSLGSS